MKNLQGKTAVVTGGGRGIGFEISKALARHGAFVIVNDLNAESAQAAAQAIIDAGGQAYAWPCDVSKPDTIDSLTQAINATTKTVDILVNNAGGGPGLSHKFLDLTPELWTTQLNINLSSAYFCCKAVIPFMLEKNYGRIINMSSTSALRGGGLRATSGYATAKAGVLGLTKTLAREFARDGISVNAITPAYHETPMHSDLTQEEKNGMIKSIPMNVAGDPADLAEVVAFLVSDSAKFVTGSVIPVDGGFTMH